MDQNINILIVEPGKAPRPASLPGTMQAAEKAAGGPLQIGCFLPQRVLLLSRADAEGLVPNRSLPGGRGCVCGTFLLCGIPEEGCHFASLSPAQQKEFQDIFKEPGEFMMAGSRVYADPDDVADAVYSLWDTLKDGESVVLTRWGSRCRQAPLWGGGPMEGGAGAGRDKG